MKPRYTDLQDIVNRVHKHFITDGNGPGFNDNRCSYVAGCAVGCLMDSEDTVTCDNHQGGLNIRGIERDISTIYNKYFEPKHLLFLQKMQGFHDIYARQGNAAFRLGFSPQMVFLCDHYGLNWPAPQ